MLKVVDVSSAQSSIDTSALDCDAVFVKVSEGTSYINPCCNSQAAGAISAGKKLGLYHFASIGNPIEQANYFYNNAKNYFDQNHALPILDYESDAANQGVAWAKTFLDEIARLTGEIPLLYTGKEITNEYDWSSVSSEYPLWGAEYANMSPQYGWNLNPWSSDKPWGSWGVPSIFQYTSCGIINGYDGYLDLSLAYFDENNFDKLTNKGGTTSIPIPVVPQPAKSQAAINGVYFIDQVVLFNGKWYVVNDDIAVKPIDYNNYVPLEPIVMVDQYGNQLDNQDIVQSDMFFTFGNPKETTFYDVNYLSDDYINISLNGEPVWFDRKALGNNLVLK